MGIPDHLTCLLRNLYAGQEATVRIGHDSAANAKTQSIFGYGNSLSCKAGVLVECEANTEVQSYQRE